MGTVLVATAGTEYDERAIEKALELLSPDHDYIFLTVTSLAGAVPLAATAAPVLPPVVVTDSEAFEEVDHTAHEEGRRRLETLVNRLQMTAATLVETGDPAERICSTAADQHADLIVIGSSDAKLVQRILRGSISDTVAHRASCPVLLMHLSEADSLESANGDTREAAPS
jgi:nucleotide-binding universal stress UspA family protein